MTIADLSTVATTSTLDMIFPISDKWKNLYDWFQIMKSLPYYKAGNEDGLNHLKQKIIQHGCIKF